MKAFCYRSGEISFGRRCPTGALPIAEGDEARLKTVIEVTARHAYDGKTLLVPGIPEADSDEEALDALFAYIEWVGKSDGITVKRRQPETAH